MKTTFILTNKGHFDTFEALFPQFQDFKTCCDSMKPKVEIAYNTETGEILYLKSQDRGV